MKNALKLLSPFFTLCLLYNTAYAIPEALSLSLVKIADTNELPPKSFHFFTRFDPPSVSQNNIVFRAHADSKSGVYLYTNKKLNLIALSHLTHVPGMTEYFYHFNYKFRDGSMNTPAIYKNTIAFLGTGNFSNEISGIYRMDKNTLSTVADLSSPIPNLALGLFKNFSDPDVMNNGNVTFIGQNERIMGLFACNQKNICRSMVNTNTPIPNGIGTFSDIYKPSVSKGEKSPNGFVFLGKGPHNQFGIYKGSLDEIETIVDANTPIPGGVGSFMSFDQACLDGNTGNIAFIGGGTLGQQGIYLFDGKNIKKLADQETFIPQSQEKFTSFSNLSCSNGKILFKGLNEKAQEGIYLFMQPGYIYKIVSNLDEINKLKIKNVFVGKYALSQNQIAILVHFENDTKGIYLAKID